MGAEVSRTQLDSLIEAGDWAAVGATAALLAAASDSQSASSRTHTTSTTDPNTNRDSASVDAARAAELDNLVDAGDWEGVVLAAARFEEAESNASLRSSLISSASDGTSLLSHFADDATSDQVSDSTSKELKRAEIRTEVEMLVARVVPEEIDNVDEMMNQFQGREEELVETLRAMQERSVAQKARVAGQQAAKIEARQLIKKGRQPGVDVSTQDTAARQAAAIGTGAAAGVLAGSALAASRKEEDENVATFASVPPPVSTPSKPAPAAVLLSPDSEPSESSDDAGTPELSPEGPRQRSALEMAIEEGDWAAVGEAAAMMSDGSVTSATTGELERLTEAVSVGTRSRTTTSSAESSEKGGTHANRAAQIEGMIDKGDWSGVVAATKRFDEADQSKGRSKEEEEALAQAEAWMRIAEQKKAAGAGDAGASEAAEWAIQRSLDQLRQADAKKAKKDTTTEEEEEEV